MRAQVLLPKVFNFSFTYNTNKKKLNPGDVVEVPFGKNKEIGVVWPEESSKLKKIKIKNIDRKIGKFSLNKNLINFIKWFSMYNMMPVGLVLKMAIGNKNLFTGPLNFQDGSQYLADGVAATDAQIWYTPQLLEGMTGDSE